MADTWSNISDLSPLKETWKIKVRVIRLWKKSAFGNPHEYNSIEMVLLDDKAGRIQATVKKALMKKFSPLVVEGGLYLITNFSVCGNSGNYKLCAHPYKINFFYTTSVKDIDGFDIPLYGFNFIAFGDITSKTFDDKCSVDVLGHIQGVSNIDLSKRNGREHKRLILQLANFENQHLNCTLWDDFVVQVSEFFTALRIEPVIFIIQFANIKEWNGVTSISNALFGTRLFLNPNIEEVVAYKKRLHELADATTQLPSQISITFSSSTLEYFLNPFERKSLDEICKTTEIVNCVTLATADCVQVEHNWFYLSCKKCNKKVVEKYLEDEEHQVMEGCNDKFFCGKCNASVQHVVPRYKVQVRVIDDTGSASFVMFDREVKQVLEKTAYELRESLVENGEVESFPSHLNEFVGKRFLFKVEISEYNLANRWQVYTVLRMSSDDSLINSFIQAQPTNQDMNSERFSMNDQSVQPYVDLGKDSVCYSGDNESISASTSILSPESKRPLDSIAGHDAQFSTNKSNVFIKAERDK